MKFCYISYKKLFFFFDEKDWYGSKLVRCLNTVLEDSTLTISAKSESQWMLEEFCISEGQLLLSEAKAAKRHLFESKRPIHFLKLVSCFIGVSEAPCLKVLAKSERTWILVIEWMNILGKWSLVSWPSRAKVTRSYFFVLKGQIYVSQSHA